ncbi:MAG: DUF3047 domain-containing protein [Candidatus Rokubacteria bacterium]|nr:DUF3047 domain-containing protein [Candidatus Rokubacteria bacterium]
MKVQTLAAALLAGALVTVAWAADTTVIEDWAKHAVGAKGIPKDWKGQNWGSPKYDFTIVENSSRRVLRLRSEDEGSTISKEIKGKVNLKETPVLEWSWRVVTLPRGGNSCAKATDDQAVQVFVVWPRFPEAVRSRIIGYVWDTTAPVGTICKSEKTGTVTYVVVRSGTAGLGQWVTEQRNVREDFKKIYGEEPDDPGGLSLSIDSNDTHSVSESFIGAVLFRRL